MVHRAKQDWMGRDFHGGLDEIGQGVDKKSGLIVEVFLELM